MAGEELNTSKTFTLATSSGVISQEKFPEQAQRIFFSVINTSPGAETISLAFGEEAVLGQGIKLSPGGYYSESSDGINDATNKQINAIGSAATATIAFQERIINRRF
jgi:hypothetical protein